MRHKQAPTQEVLDEVLAPAQATETGVEPAEASTPSDKMSRVKFVAQVVGEILENLPHGM